MSMIVTVLLAKLVTAIARRLPEIARSVGSGTSIASTSVMRFELKTFT